MLRDSSVSVSGDEDIVGWTTAERETPYWLEVDRELRGIAKRRAALDADEARWLREAERVHIWKRLGLVSMIDYLERVLSYAPRTAQQRMQVARALEDLPVLTASLATGELSFSAVRELARIATRSTENEWCGEARGKTLRQIEELVSGRKRGDRPEDPPDPEARTYDVTFKEVSAATYAKYRQARLRLDEENDSRRTDDQILAACCDAILDGAQLGESDGRARNQICYQVCPQCHAGSQRGGGALIPVSAATIARAMCDAQHIGSIDADHPERATQGISPALDRFIRARDRGCCQIPGCRSTRGLEIHHIIHREHGGKTEASNLALACSSCHAAHHEGRITISGVAPHHIKVTRRYDHVSPVGVGIEPDPTVRVHPPSVNLTQVMIQTQARDALVSMGWKIAIARAAVEEACAHVGADAPLEKILFEASRRCSKPTIETMRRSA